MAAMNRDRALTLRQVGDLLQVPIGEVESEIASGRLAAFRVGRHVRISRADLDHYIARQGATPPRFGHTVRPFILAIGLVLTMGLVWAVADFPFPHWPHAEIGPQAALYVDEDAASDPDPDRYAPINAPLDYRRYNDAPNPDGTGYTHMLMSLQHQNDLPPGSLSYPWAFFVNLDTNHDLGDGVGSIVNLWNRGEGWASAYHADVFAKGRGTAIGSNIETFVLGEERAHLVGLNVQNKAHRGSVGLQVQTGPLPDSHPWWETGMDGSWDVGLRLSGMPGAGYYRTGIELDRHTRGRYGMRMRGEFDTGIDLGGNSLRVNGGVPIELDGGNGLALRYNPERSRIEFVQGDEIIAWLDTSRRDAELGR
jgi:excisionase family DNA binding protein